MSDFDPQDVLPTAAPKRAAGGDFESADVLQLDAGQDFNPADLEEPVEAPPVKDLSKDLTESDFQEIASKHGVPVEDLKSLAPYYGARAEVKDLPEAMAQGARASVGMLGRSIGLGIPQFAAKKAASPQLEAAIDELTERGEAQRGLINQVAEGVVAPVTYLGKGAKAGARIAEAAGIGGTLGLTSSKQGEELSGAVTGATIGAGLGIGAEAFGRLLSKAGGTEAERVLAARRIEEEAPRLDEGTEKMLASRSASESSLEEHLAAPKDLTSQEAEVIVREQLDPETLTHYLNPATEEGHLIRQKLGDVPSKEAIEQQLASDIIERRARDFAEDLTGTRPKTIDDAREAIKAHASRQGQEAVDNAYRLFREEKAAMDYIAAEAARGGRGEHFGNKALNFVSDAQFVLRDIDQTMGTSAEAVHRELNRDYNRMSFPRNEARKQVAAIYQLNKGVDEAVTNSDRIYRALDTGNVAGLNPAEQKVAGAFKQFFQDQLQFVNELVRSKDPHIAPLSIPKRENYVPHLLKDSPELLADITRRTDEIRSIASQVYGKDVTALSSKEFAELASQGAGKDLVDALRVFDSSPVKTGRDLMARLKDTFESRGGRIRLDTEAKAALERAGNMPEWMRETNLYRLADRWTTNTLRHLYLRRTMDQLGSIARRVEKAGGVLESNYLKHLLQDINGIRRGTAADFTRQVVVKWQTALDLAAERAKSPGAKAAANVAKALPELIQDLGRQIYPNLLGLNPKAMIQNSMQPFLKTAPELGSKYGYVTTLRGTMHALKNLPQQLERVKQLGLAPAEFTSQYQRAAASGIRRNSLYAVPSEMAQRMGQASLYLYSKLDTLNRAITLSVSDMMAHDLARGSSLAKQSLSKFPTSVQRGIARAGSEQEVAGILASHLNASTQYNYNRASMSEWGRTMGPLFSIFSKWPTATAGEIIQELRAGGKLKGSLRNAEKYLYPLLMLKAADWAMSGGAGPKEGFSDTQKKLFGGTGIAQAAPIGALEGIAKGDFFTPPAVDMVIKGVVQPMLSGDPGKLQKSFANSLQQWTPGSVYIRFLTDDLLTFATGRRPEGSDFIERTQEGLHQLTK